MTDRPQRPPAPSAAPEVAEAVRWATEAAADNISMGYQVIGTQAKRHLRILAAAALRSAPDGWLFGEMLAALKWARTCVPYESDCHHAIIAVIDKVKAPTPGELASIDRRDEGWREGAEAMRKAAAIIADRRKDEAVANSKRFKDEGCEDGSVESCLSDAIAYMDVAIEIRALPIPPAKEPT